MSREAKMVSITLTNGKVAHADPEIAGIVQTLNDGGFQTKASCSGHGFRPGNIALCDGRELIIARNFKEARRIDRLFSLSINGERIASDEWQPIETAPRNGKPLTEITEPNDD